MFHCNNNSPHQSTTQTLVQPPGFLQWQKQRTTLCDHAEVGWTQQQLVMRDSTAETTASPYKWVISSFNSNRPCWTFRDTYWPTVPLETGLWHPYQRLFIQFPNTLTTSTQLCVRRASGRMNQATSCYSQIKQYYSDKNNTHPDTTFHY